MLLKESSSGISADGRHRGEGIAGDAPVSAARSVGVSVPSTLTPAQAEAVRAQGHVLITACPGSGKTTVLKHRAAFLLASNPDAILCGVTFSRESAGELDRRIRDEAGNVGARMACGTFHSLCKRQLDEAGKRWSAVSEARSDDLLRRAWAETEKDTGCSLEDAAAFVKSIKEQVNPVLPSVKDDPRILVYEGYQARLRRTGEMDFADMLVESLRGMQDGSVRPVFTRAGPVTHMLVDEFQDTDSVQLAWVLEHLRHGVEVTVVGDDDQSIYGWRGSLGFAGMEKFRARTGARHIALDRTFRCAPEILSSAARVIAHNAARVEKRLVTSSKVKGLVRQHQGYSQPNEALTMAQHVARAGRPGEWGVLARTNRQLDRAEAALTARAVPYRRVGGRSFWTDVIPGRFLSACRSLVNGDMAGMDDLLVGFGVDEGTLSHIHTVCRSHEPEALERFLRSGANDVHGHFANLRRSVTDWRARLGDDDVRGAIEGIAEVIGQDTRLFRPETPIATDQNKRVLKECVDVLSEMDGHLADRVKTIQKGAEGAKDAGDDVVHLMTLHASKGLEFDRVWILGCTQGVLPSAKSPEEEERRLFYVGMTRAKRALHLSYVQSKRSGPSMFLGEAG